MAVRRVPLVVMIWAAALGCQGSVVTVQDDNDFYSPAATDRWYTHGFRFQWQLPEELADTTFGAMMHALPFAPEIGTATVSVVGGHKIFTPQGVLRRELVSDDRPYAGWLYAGLLAQNLVPGSSRYRDDRLDMWEIDAGVVGPSAFARESQHLVHSLLGSVAPRGWRNQLGDEPGLVLRYDRLDRWLFHDVGRVQVDGNTAIGLTLGNIEISAHAGWTFRLGGLARDFTTRDTTPSLGGERTLPFYVFATVDGRLVAHDVFLDGSTFHASPHVTRNWYTADVTAGIVIPGSTVDLQIIEVIRSPEFKETSSFTRYGAIRFVFRF